MSILRLDEDIVDDVRSGKVSVVFYPYTRPFMLGGAAFHWYTDDRIDIKITELRLCDSFRDVTTEEIDQSQYNEHYDLLMAVEDSDVEITVVRFKVYE